MPFKQLLHDKDIHEVLIAHIAAIGLTFTDIEQALKIISLSAAIGYTIYKWYKAVKGK